MRRRHCSLEPPMGNSHPVIYFLDRKVVLNPDSVLRIGRDQDNTIVLPHTSVSRFHAVVEWSRGVDRARRYDQPLSLIMMDIDHFKGVNDTLGHQKGDEVLTVVASLVQENTRASDVVSRYGGEEFAVILPQASAGHAAAFAEKIRAVIESQTGDAVGLQITVSLGVATVGRDDDESSLVERADAALYASKRKGRNRYTLAP